MPAAYEPMPVAREPMPVAREPMPEAREPMRATPFKTRAPSAMQGESMQAGSRTPMQVAQ